MGKGKTGGEILNLYPKEKIVVFDSKRDPLWSLNHCDVIISFVPGDILLQYAPILMKSQIPVISGSTGHSWRESLSQLSKKKNAIGSQALIFSRHEARSQNDSKPF